MENHNDYLRVCEEAVRAAARVVQDWRGRTETREKGPADLVTQADLESQATVRRIVLGAFPDHCLLGEEEEPAAGKGGRPHLPERPAGCFAQMGAAPFSRFRWIVDPLDGTTNYVHGVPHYCVSLALERDGELIVGAVYDPALDECFTAVAGGGARLDGRAIRAAGATQLSEALAAASFPPAVRPDSPDLKLFLEMIPRCQAIRRTGSTALNLCYMAAGRFDLYWSFSAHVWDVAAGVLILREAGGHVTSPAGGQFSLDNPRFLAAANPTLHAQLSKIAAAV